MYMISIGTKAQQHICQVQSITDNLNLQIRMITYYNFPMYKQNKSSQAGESNGESNVSFSYSQNLERTIQSTPVQVNKKIDFVIQGYISQIGGIMRVFRIICDEISDFKL